MRNKGQSSTWHVFVTVTDEFGVTILKPCRCSVWSQWLLEKQKPDITPPNLRSRSWHDFPRVEVQVHTYCTRTHLAKQHTNIFPPLSLFQKKSPGPPFGTNMGRGLTLRERSGGSAAERHPVRSCPEVLEMRELYQHRPFTTPLKNSVDTRLKVNKHVCGHVPKSQVTFC